MSVVALIPARYASSRFPGKPLARIAGRPMIEWVYRGTCEAKTVDDVRIATDDARIAEACASFGAAVDMTRGDHRSGSDRIAEVAARLSCEVVVNVQGDEPLIRGFVIDAAVEALRTDEEASVSTVVHRAPPEARDDPNRVKVTCDRRGRALYFSRAPIPAERGEDDVAPLLQHVGLYAYRRSFLLHYVTLEAGLLERTEQLEQLRILEHGYAIRVAEIEGWESCPVDVPEDVPVVERGIGAAGS